MSEEGENENSREKATENLFDFSEREETRKEKPVEDDHNRVNYEEELSLQNIFIKKEGEGAGREEASETKTEPEQVLNQQPSAVVESTEASGAAAQTPPAHEQAEEALDQPVSAATPQHEDQPGTLRSSSLRMSQDETEAAANANASAESDSTPTQGADAAQSASQEATVGAGVEEIAQNHAPIAGPNVAASADEGAETISGQLIATDIDENSVLTFSLPEGFSAPDGFVLNLDGSYSFDPGVEAYEHLNVGDSQVLSIPVTVTDVQGATDTSQIQITIAGTNDAPVAGANVFSTVQEGAGTIGGQLTSTDLDDNATATFAIASGSESPDGFVLNADGSYSFDSSNPAYEQLSAGDSQVITIPVTVTDEHGAQDTSQIQITLLGTNDAPVAGASVFATVEEGASAISGQLSSGDMDDNASVVYSISEGVSAPDGFVINADGSYSFDPSGEAYDHLNVGDSAVLTIPVTVTDDQGATDTSSIQITVTGTNDAPVAGANVAAKFEEGASAISGRVTATDLDDGSTATFSITQGSDAPSGFELNSNGTYSFDPDDEAYQNLSVGDSALLTIPVTVTDDQGATDTSQIQIRVVGTNDGPVAGADVTVSVEEGSSTVSGQLTSTDLDEGATAEFSITEGGDAPPGFEINPDGSYSFDPSNEAYDHLNVGDSTVLTIPVTVTDDQGATDTSQIQITVVGTNDAPVAGADVAAKVEEGSRAIKGQLTSTDLDDDSTVKFAVSEGADAPAGFEINTDGTYSFDPSDEAYDHLNVGDSTVLTIPVTVTDDQGATDTSQIQITVVGTNDAPVAGADVAAKVEEGSSVIKGQLTSSDLDDDATAKFSVTEGADAPAGFEMHSDGTYSFDPSDEAYDHLNVGDATVLTIPVTVTDDQGATDTSQIQITVVGTNDAPVAGADVAAKVEEGSSAIKGQLTSTDLDDDSTARFTITEGSKAPDGFEIHGDGTYSFDPSDEAYDHLNVGDSTVLTIPVTVTDDQGATDTSQIQITVVGTNDAPVAGADVAAKVEEGSSAIKGQLTSTDLDDDSTAKFSVSEGANAPAGFEMNADGTYSFDPSDEAYDHLNVGDSTVLTIPVTVTDDQGATDTSQIQITVVGTNDAPVAGADVAAKVEEGSSAIKGQLTSTDLDDDATAKFSVTEGADAPAGFEINPDGTYSFDPSDEAYDHLNVGDSTVLTIPVTVTDDQGATDTSQIQITVVGTNDAPVAGADVAAKVEEGSSAIKGQLTSTDLDDDSTAKFSVTEGADAPAGFEMHSDGTYTFDPSDEAYDHLNVGDSTVLTIPVTVTDDQGATDTSQIQITVVGTNDAPVAGADVAAKVEEGSSAIEGQLTSTDLDDDATAKFSISEGADAPAGFEIKPDGSYSFDPSDEAYDHLNVGDSTVLTIPVTVTDDQGATDTSQIQITVVGTNDAPVAGADVAAKVEEGSSAIKGQLTSTDLDDDSTAKFSVSEGADAPAGFEINPDGTYSFDPSDEAYDHLNVGDSTVLTIPVTVTDDQGATDTSQIQITVVGTNDAPVAGADVAAKVEEGSSVIKGQLTSSDLDDDATAKFSVTEGADAPAGFEMHSDGTYSFDPSDEAYDHLNVGDATVLTIPVTVTDDQGATDTSQIQITVVGTNDAPVAGADVAAKVEEGSSAIKGQLTSTDLDDDSTAKFSVSEGADAPAGFEMNADGTYSFDPGDEAYDHLNVGDSTVLTIPVTVTDDQGATDTSQIQITVVGTNDAPVAGADVAAKVEEGSSAIKGQLTSTDLDDDATAKFSVTEGADAPAGFEMHSDGTYTFDPSDEAYDHLNVGDSTVLTIPVTVTDDQGGTDTSQIQITVVGTNDAPVAGADVAAKVEEGSSAIKGQLTSTDLDDDSTAKFSVTEGADAPAGFEMHSDGTYSFDPSDEAYDHLNVGDSTVLTIPVTVTDDQGATDTSQIQITVVGTNDAPVAGADVQTKVEEGSSAIKGQLTSTDLDDDATAKFSVTEGADAPAGFEMHSDGTYSFDPSDEAYDHLNVGDSTVLTIPVTVTDDQGATDTSQIQITVVGTNDAPVAGADVQTKLEEGSSAIKGQLTSTDLDDDSTAKFSVSEGADAPAGFEMHSDGTYSFDPSDEAYDHLNVGDSTVLTIPVTVTDDQGATDTSQIQITVVGTNDAPVAGADVQTKLEEGSSVIKGQLTSSDLDDDSTAKFSVSEGADAPAGFEMNADGTYSFDPSDEAYDHLNVGDSTVLTIPVTVTDDQGATDTSQIQITVVGTNDAPVAGADVQTKVEEGSSAIKGQLTSTDLDDDATAKFSVTEGADAPAGFEMHSDGTYSFDPSDEAYDHLNVGDSTVLTIPVTVTDDQGATDTSQIQITVVGTNDAPVAGADVQTKLEEGSSAIKGQLTSTDLDDDATAKFSVTEGVDAPAGFEMHSDGTYSFDPGDEAYDHLNVGDSTVLTIPVTVTDDQGATDTSQIQITVVGTNDAPVAGADVQTKLEEGSSAIKGQLTSTDLDDDSTAKFSVSEGADAPAGFEMHSDGTYSFDPSDEAYDHLNVGDSTELTIPVTVTDDQGGTDTSSIRITVTGTNDAPVAGATVSNFVDEGAGSITGQMTSKDVDDGSTATYTVSEDGVIPDGFELNEDGSYSFDANDAAYDSLAEGENQVLDIPVTVTDEHGATDTSHIQITVTGTNDAPSAISATGGTVAENVGAGTVVVELSATDADDGDKLSFSIADDSSLFEVQGDQIVVKDGAQINYEADSEHTLTVQVTDAAGESFKQDITIEVTDINETPTDITLSADSVNENAVGGTVVADISTADEDGGESFTYDLSDDSGLFEISGDQIVVKEGAEIDFESDAAHDISVQVTDSAGNTYSEKFSIDVNDIVENVGPVAGDDSLAGSFEPENATLAVEINFDDGVPAAARGSITAEESGQVGGAADFSSAKLSVSGIDLSGETGDQTTVSMWVQCNPEGGWEMLAASDIHDMALLGGNIGFNTGRGDLFGTDASELADGEWHHVVGIFTNGDVTQNSIFIDGVPQEMSQIQGRPYSARANIDSDDGTMHFGSWGIHDGYRFTGSMDEIKVFNGDLSPEEVSELYEIESGHDHWQNSGQGGTEEDTAVVINPNDLMANDVDADGDTLTIVAVDEAEHGTVELNEDGEIVFTPDANYNGEASFTYTISDGNGGTDSATVTLDVASVNDMPVIEVVNTISVDEDGKVSVKYKVDDIDSDDVKLEASSENGTVTINDDGTMTFTPDEGFNGDTKITLTATDSDGGVTTQSIDVDVGQINDAPVAQAPVSTKVAEGGDVVSGQLTATDDDAGDTATWSISEGADAPDGFSLNEDGSYTFDPGDAAYDHLNAGDMTTLKVPVTVTDEEGATDTSHIQITVSGTNDTPVVAKHEISTEEGGDTVKGALPASDVDDGSKLTFSAEGKTPAGFTLNEDGSYEFDPADEAYDGYSAGESHTEAVTYTVTDEHGASSKGVLYVGVEGTNDKVSMVVDANPENNSIPENAVKGTPVGLVAQADDADGDEVRYSLVDSKGNEVEDGAFAVDAKSGVVTVNDPGQIDYEDSTSHDLNIQATSADGSSTQQGFSVEITDVDENVGPEANSDIGRIWVSESTNEVVENLQIGTFDGEKADVSDWGELVDGKAVFKDGDVTITTSVSEGELTSYNKGGSVGFGIGNEDRGGLDKTETLTVEIEGADANRVEFTLDGLGGWFDEDNKNATEVQITAYDQNGDLIETQGGYRESGDFQDTYSFETETPVQRFEITSEGGGGNFVVQNMTLTATDTIEVPGHWENVTADGTITIDVLANDTDADGDTLSIVGVESPVVVDGVEVGTAEVVEVDGVQKIQFTPDESMQKMPEGESQKVSFEYKVSDGEGGTDSAKVSLTIDPAAEAADDGGDSFEHAIELDGKDDYIDTQADMSWSEKESFSLSATVTPDTVDGRDAIMGKGEDIGSYKEWEYTLMRNGDEATFVYWNEGGGHSIELHARDAFEPDESTALTVTFDAESNKASLYVNGELADTDSSSGNHQDRASTLKVGMGYSWGNSTFDGEIDNVQVHDVALDPKEVAEVAEGGVVENGLAVHYDFEGEEPLADKSGNGHDAVMHGGGEVVETGPAESEEVRAKSFDDEKETVKSTDEDDRISGTDGDDVIKAGDGDDKVKAADGDDKVAGEGGNDKIDAGAGDDLISGGTGDDAVWGGEGNDTYIMNTGDGSDYFDGGSGGGWTDTIQLTADPEDGDSPWSITVNGEQVEYDLAAGALDLQPDTSGVITLADGTEMTFDGIESVQW